MQPEAVPEPWRGFFSELDSALTEAVRLHCIGGFVIAQCYGLKRPTSDVDFVSITPSDQLEAVLRLGGEGSTLHLKYRVHVQRVSVVQLCLNYEERLIEMFPGTYRNIRLFALDPYDLALSKLDRNAQLDRDDVKYLIRTVPLRRDVFEDRYHTELRHVWIGNTDSADITMGLWLDAWDEWAEG